MEQARPAASVTDFPGLAIDVDPRDLLAGAAEVQSNLACLTMGEITVRRGMREVTFEEQ